MLVCGLPCSWQVIPKVRGGLTRLSKATEEHCALLGHLLFVAQKVAMQGMCSRMAGVVQGWGHVVSGWRGCVVGS